MAIDIFQLDCGETGGHWLSLNSQHFWGQVVKRETRKESENEIGGNRENEIGVTETKKGVFQEVGEGLFGWVMAAQKLNMVRTKVAVEFSNTGEICDLNKLKMVATKASFVKVE